MDVPQSVPSNSSSSESGDDSDSDDSSSSGSNDSDSSASSDASDADTPSKVHFAICRFWYGLQIIFLEYVFILRCMETYLLFNFININISHRSRSISIVACDY